MAKIKTVNSLSGGKTSSYIAANYPADYEIFSLVCINDKASAPKDKSIIKYVNEKLGDKFINQYGEFIATAEDDKTIIAMRDLEQIIGKPIIWLRGASFDEVIDSGTHTWLPSWARRYCTEKLKMLPIFLWAFNEIGVKCQMRIGFRFDEFSRQERFFNGSDPTNFSIPVSCRTYGKKLQKHEKFKWRDCSFPLIRDGIKHEQIIDFWKGEKGLITDADGSKRQIEFPIISNCVGCFHKKVDTLSIMWNQHPEKMRWFSSQEKKNMGTWLDSKILYETIGLNSKDWLPEMLRESGASCDSGGCTD